MRVSCSPVSPLLRRPFINKILYFFGIQVHDFKITDIDVPECSEIYIYAYNLTDCDADIFCTLGRYLFFFRCDGRVYLRYYSIQKDAHSRDGEYCKCLVASVAKSSRTSGLSFRVISCCPIRLAFIHSLIFFFPNLRASVIKPWHKEKLFLGC